MSRYPSCYYLCRSGHLKTKAEEYRKRFIRLKNALFDVIKPYGKYASIDYDMMLINGVQMQTNPKGWTKPGPGGLSRPLQCKANAELLKYFTPSGHYQITKHPELQEFFTWLKCPSSYEYTTDKNENRGWTSISWNSPGLFWYDENGPILLVTPDVHAAKIQARAEGKKITDNVLDWTPPPGAKRILKEEWSLMQAEFETMKDIERLLR